MQIGTVSTSSVTISTRGASGKTATQINTEGFTLQKDLSESKDNFSPATLSISDYQNQLRLQGAQKQSFVVTKGGTTVASIGQDGGAMFQDPKVAKIWDEVGGDMEAFASALKKAGYDSNSYEQGTGPTYAEIHQRIHGESYETLMARQTMAFSREMALLAGQQSFFSTIA